MTCGVKRYRYPNLLFPHLPFIWGPWVSHSSLSGWVPGKGGQIPNKSKLSETNVRSLSHRMGAKASPTEPLGCSSSMRDGGGWCQDGKGCLETNFEGWPIPWRTLAYTQHFCSLGATVGCRHPLPPISNFQGLSILGWGMVVKCWTWVPSLPRVASHPPVSFDVTSSQPSFHDQFQIGERQRARLFLWTGAWGQTGPKTGVSTGGQWVFSLTTRLRSPGSIGKGEKQSKINPVSIQTRKGRVVMVPDLVQHPHFRL